MRLLAFYLALAASLNMGQGQDYCLARDNAPYVLFSTDTAYENIHGKSTSQVTIPQCKPVQFWLLSRHGTRYPDEEGITAMWTLPDLRDKVVKHHEKKDRGSLCPEDLENLKKWTPQVVLTEAEDLAIPQGYNDLYSMAKRFQSRFPTLLNQSYSRDKFEVRFTYKQRTTLTATAFLDGLFGSTSTPYKSCKKWQKDVDDNDDTLEEQKKFKKDEITAIHDACAFEKAWRVTEVSPWCAAFSKDEHELNKKMGCPPVKDFLDRFSKIESGEEQPAGVLYFSHASMLQLVLNPLQIAKDEEKLKHSNFEEMKDRKWRTSQITPFATNLAVVFFKCDADEQYKVQFYLGEHLLNLDGCNQGVCDWSYIKDKYGSISEDCNLDWC
ncbi:Multiple inositol polyphosphate phosphatase 1 [Blattella germanica]|nr:Multiple inositol polyphosphate phosphatase 1 [Blattella germanica]